MAGTTTQRTPEATLPVPTHPAPTHSSATILLVDDDAGIRTLLGRGLAPLGVESILEAADGKEAQRILAGGGIDVVVTDVLMPRMDGLELMRWARAEFPETLWIVLSGLDTFNAAVDALQLGAFDFISKPLVLEHVRVAVRNALDKLGLARERERLYQDIERSNALLARKVEDLNHLCRMLEDQSEVIHADLARAEVIQRALLPQSPPHLPGWSLETLYRPGSNVGGDFFDFVVLDDRYLGLVIADAAGHGVAAAMLSVLFKHRLALRDETSGTPLRPAEVLRRVNGRLHRDLTAPGDFITAAYALLDLGTGALTIASAGHPPCLWVEPAGDARHVSRTGPALGLEADARYEEVEGFVGAGGRLLFYTDGVLEGSSSGPTPEELTRMIGRPGGDRRALLEELFDRATADATHDPDDITMILLERRSGTSGINDAPRPHGPHGHAVPELRILLGARQQRAYLALCGRATWMRSQAFLDSAAAALAQHHELVVDLGECEHLDSTFLGTLHEVMTRWPMAGLQRVPDRARHLFEELSMRAVMDRIRAQAESLPDDMRAAKTRQDDAALHGERVLKAHETLAALSDENEQQFGAVIETLRSELGKA